MLDKRHYGGCLCTNVRYEILESPCSSFICHCASCRKAAGAQSVAWVTLPNSAFSLISGEPTTYLSSARVKRSFCAKCGTTLTYRHDSDEGYVDVTAASLDEPNEFPPTHHAWLKDKVDWETVDDRLNTLERSGFS